MILVVQVAFIIRTLGTNDELWSQVYLLALLGLPSLFLAIWLPIADKFQSGADWFGVVYLGTYALTILVLTITNPFEISPQMRNQAGDMAGLFYIIYLGLLSPNYLFNFVARPLIYTFCQVIVLVARSQNDEANVIAAILMHIFSVCLLETIFHVQYKQQAKFYLSIKITGF